MFPPVILVITCPAVAACGSAGIRIQSGRHQIRRTAAFLSYLIAILMSA